MRVKKIILSIKNLGYFALRSFYEITTSQIFGKFTQFIQLTRKRCLQVSDMMKFIILLTLIAFLNISQCQVSENSETPGKTANKLFVSYSIPINFHPAICFLPELAGNERSACRAFMPRFRYDSTSKLCVKFIYGGCYGTENRFVTLRECVEVCRAENTFIPSSKFFDSF